MYAKSMRPSATIQSHALDALKLGSEARDENMPAKQADFFLWGFVKDKVYTDTPQSIQELKEKIRAVIDEIKPEMCQNVMEHFMIRAWSCKRSHGDHINDIVFHH